MFQTNLVESDLKEIIHDAVFRALNSTNNTSNLSSKEVARRLLTLDEAAKRINRKKSTIYQLVCKGKISSIKRGKELLFTEEALDGYINLITKENQTGGKGAACHA